MISIDILYLTGRTHCFDGGFYGYGIFLVSIDVSFRLTDKTFGAVYVPEGQHIYRIDTSDNLKSRMG